ncbi:hypothetical protein SSP35_01_00840 [Streptomyces sp. NBRC 110611]|nr:hypothetical protein SSP35_01_00840 [Streptomyces sp. NBRC 110611]
MGVPPSARSALGVPGPSRTPRPAAGITAAVRTGREGSDIVGSGVRAEPGIGADRFVSSGGMGMAWGYPLLAELGAVPGALRLDRTLP